MMSTSQSYVYMDGTRISPMLTIQRARTWRLRSEHSGLNNVWTVRISQYVKRRTWKTAYAAYGMETHLVKYFQFL